MKNIGPKSSATIVHYVRCVAWGAEQWDSWHADAEASPIWDRIVADFMGHAKDFASSSLVPSSARPILIDALDLRTADTLLDLGCGRGSWGLSIATRVGCNLIGVDWAPNALRLARQRALHAGMSSRSRFAVGTLSALDLADDCVDAVLCIDALNFAPRLEQAAAEIHRVLRPGRRLVATSWQPEDLGGAKPLSTFDVLEATGFADITVTERRDWHTVERALYEHVAVMRVGIDDSAMSALRREAATALRTCEDTRRVLITARAVPR